MSAHSLPRMVSAAVLAAAGLAVSLPSPAMAQPAADPGDRSVTIKVRNFTDLRLTLSDDSNVIEGVWTQMPPSSIKRLAIATFGSESDSDMGGTEGEVTYSTNVGDVDIYWRNPWTRDNEVTCDAPVGSGLVCERVNFTLGTHPTVTFNLR